MRNPESQVAAAMLGVELEDIQESIRLRSGIAVPVSLNKKGMMIATFDPKIETLSLLEATTGRSSSAIDLLGAVAMRRPTALVTVQGSLKHHGGAFLVEEGHAVAAHAFKDGERIETWLPKLQAMFPARLAGAGEVRIDAARHFVEDVAIEALLVAQDVGSKMMILQGDVRWHGPKVPLSRSPRVEFLLMEAARQTDELPTILREVGSLDRVLTRQRVPTRVPDANDGPGADMRALWDCIDDRGTAQSVLEGAMMSRFRGLVALRELLLAECVAFSPGAARAATGVAREELTPRPAARGEYSFTRSAPGARTERIDVGRTPVAPRRVDPVPLSTKARRS